MNMTFRTTFPKKEWVITDKTIQYKNKKILLSEITEVKHDPTNSPASNGIIQVFYGNGFFSKFLTLPYPHAEKQNGQKAYEYILGIVKGEVAVTKEKKLAEVRENGYKKYCNVCGHIFCYTLDDLQKNKELKKQEGLNLVSSLAGGLSGHYAAGANSLQTAHDLESRIVDYDKCPSCGSRDIRDATEEDISAQKQVPASPALSTADELKKFKELLDMGIITQEEFDQKKKQLLGL